MDKCYDRLENVKARNALMHWQTKTAFELDCLLKDERQKYIGTNINSRWLITDRRNLDFSSAAMIFIVNRFTEYSKIYQQDHYDEKYTAANIEDFYLEFFTVYFKSVYAGIFDDESLDGLLDISTVCEYDTSYFIRAIEGKQKETKLQFTALLRDATNFRIHFPRAPRNLAKVIQATVCAFVGALPDPRFSIYERRANVCALTSELILISQQINAARRYIENNKILYDEKNDLQCKAMEECTKAMEIFMEAIDHVISARAAIMEDNSY